MVELSNVGHQNSCYKISDGVAIGLQRFVVGKGFKVEMMHHLQDRTEGFELYQERQVRTGELQPRYSINTLFCFDLVLVKLAHIRRRRLLIGTVQGNDHFSCIFIDGLYQWIPLQVWEEVESQ